MRTLAWSPPSWPERTTTIQFKRSTHTDKWLVDEENWSLLETYAPSHSMRLKLYFLQLWICRTLVSYPRTFPFVPFFPATALLAAGNVDVSTSRWTAVPCDRTLSVHCRTLYLAPQMFSSTTFCSSIFFFRLSSMVDEGSVTPGDGMGG